MISAISMAHNCKCHYFLWLQLQEPDFLNVKTISNVKETRLNFITNYSWSIVRLKQHNLTYRKMQSILKGASPCNPDADHA